MTFERSTSGYKPGPIGFANQIAVVNGAGKNINLTPDWGFMNNWVYYANTDTTVTLTHTDSSKGGAGFVDNQLLTRFGNGIIDGVTNDYWMHSFYSHNFVAAGVSIAGRYGFYYQELNYSHGYHGGVPATEQPVGTVNNQIGFMVPYLSKAGKNIGYYNGSNLVNKPRVIALANASADIDLEATLLHLNNTSGGLLTLTSVPTIPDGYEEGHQITVINKSANTVVIQGEASLTNSNVAETLTLAQNQGATLTFINGLWAEISNPSARGTVTQTGTETLTNKRITSRINTVASSATPAINCNTTDQFNVTALATAITSFTTNLTGTPTDGQELTIRIKDNGTTRAIAHGASFTSGPATMITNTVINKTHLEKFKYDAVALLWVCVASDPVGY